MGEKVLIWVPIVVIAVLVFFIMLVFLLNLIPVSSPLPPEKGMYIFSPDYAPLGKYIQIGVFYFDGENWIPLQGAMVSIKGVTSGLTGRDGYNNLLVVREKEGDYTIIATKEGYETVTKTIKIVRVKI